MKTAAIFLLLVLSAVQAQAGPIGTRASQFVSMTVTIDGSNYGLNTLDTYTRTSQGLSVFTSPSSLVPGTQPPGPEASSPYSAFFTIPESIIRMFY